VYLTNIIGEAEVRGICDHYNVDYNIIANMEDETNNFLDLNSRERTNHQFWFVRNCIGIVSKITPGFRESEYKVSDALVLFNLYVKLDKMGVLRA